MFSILCVLGGLLVGFLLFARYRRKPTTWEQTEPRTWPVTLKGSGGRKKPETWQRMDTWVVGPRGIRIIERRQSTD